MYGVLCWLILGLSSGQETLTSADVFVEVGKVRAELELIRREMGRPIYQAWNPTISNAAPRQVYFQARTMLDKSDQLCFELVRERGVQPEGAGLDIQSADVYRLVRATRDRLTIIKSGLGIPESIEPVSLDPSKKSSDVLLEIMHANRQLNMLMDQGFSPGNVYREVTMSVHYVSRLLALYNGVERLPDEPALERGKQPNEVYIRLLACFTLVTELSLRAELDPLMLRVDASLVKMVTPSDVYDLTMLIQAELAYLHGQTNGVLPPRESFYPGRKFPSHVYRRAGLLQAQLEILKEADRKTPHQLGRSGGG